jgi:protein ImuA
MGDKAATLEHLRSRIAAIEQRPALAEDPRFLRPLTQDTELSPLDLIGTPTGLLHEIFTDDLRNSGATLAFALGLSRSFLSPRRPALLYLQLVKDAQELGVPYAPGFNRFGIDPDELIIGRIETVTELLWAMEEAMACDAVAAVIADTLGEEETLDFTVSRRLSLRASAAETSAFMLRYGTGREASAAKLRWRVDPAISAAPFFDPESPGPPRFAVTLEKSRLDARAQRLEGQSFELDWIDHGFVIAERSHASRIIGRWPTAPRLEPAALGDRLSQAS